MGTFLVDVIEQSKSGCTSVSLRCSESKINETDITPIVVGRTQCARKCWRILYNVTQVRELSEGITYSLVSSIMIIAIHNMCR
jgi:hypothetical protein